MISQLKHLDFLGWFYGLMAAIIGGGASSVTAAVSAGFIDPEKFNLTHPMATIKLMAVVFLLNALMSMFLYLKQSPMPPIVNDAPAAPTVKGVVILALILAIGGGFQAARAQELFKDLVAGGVAYNPQGAPQVTGTALYAKQISQGLYSFNLIDITPVYDSMARLGVKTLTMNATSGLAQHLRDIGPARVYIVATAGLGSSSEATGFAYSAGGAAVIPIGARGWCLMPNLRVLKNTQTDFQAIYGVAVGWGR